MVELRGRIDSNSFRAFEMRLMDLLARGRSRLVLDMRDTVYVSSIGLRALLVVARAVVKAPGKLVLSNLSPEVHRVFSLAGFTDLFVIERSAEAAIISCGA